MDRYDRHRGGDRYSNSSEEAHHYTSSNRRGFSSSLFSDGGDAPFNHNRQENHRGGGGGGGDGGRNSNSQNFRAGSGGSEHHRPSDSPPRYPPRLGGGEGGGKLRPIGDEIGGFPPLYSGEAGYPPIGGQGGGFRAIGSGLGDVGAVHPIDGGTGGGGGFQPMGSGDDDGRFRPMVGGAGDGRFRPVGDVADGGRMGLGADGGIFQPMGDGGGFPVGAGGYGRGFRPMGGAGDVGGFGSENYHMPHPPPLAGQKRGYPFSGREKSPDRLGGAGFAKLFVGSVPRTATEEDIRPLFDEHGRVLEVALIRDKRTGQQQGCCFIKYASSEEAERAIRGLHNQYTLPGGVAPIQVRYADGERERLGATEYKLFVGALSKQTTEMEIEEVFSSYGRIEDIYLMRDEMKQNRGCAFVKYSNLEMAQAAINALNGIYTMRGCNQPLTVKFADHKRSRPGESRVGPAFGNPGFGPRPSAPGIGPAQSIIEPLRGPIPPNPWPSVSPQNLGPPSNVGVHTFNGQLPARSGGTPTSNTPATVGDLPGNPDGSHPGSSVSSAPISQNYNQSLPQVPSSALNQSPLQRPLPSPPNVIPFTNNMQRLRGPHMQQGQVPMPYNEGRNPYNQAPPSQHLPGPNGQLPIAKPQRQHNTTPGPGQQAAAANQQQPPVQELHESPQLAQMVSQQKQTLQATFQSSKQAFNQLQQQMLQLQPSNQNRTVHQGVQATNQQAPWAGIAPQAVTSTTVSASPAVTPNCNWSEHMSPDGYKYYYNSVTGESKWEKPEELKAYEQQQQKPSSQYNQMERQPQGLSTIHATPQMQVPLQGQQHQAQFQNQIRPYQQPSQSSFQVPGLSEKQGNKEHGYAPIPAGNATMNNNLARYQQASQEWMWKNKPSGT